MKKRVYISGAISNNPNYMTDFANAEQHLQKLGYEVINPTNVCAMLPTSFTHDEYMRVCKAMLKSCNFIYNIESNIPSVGRELEIKWAKKFKIALLYLGDALYMKVNMCFTTLDEKQNENNNA